ncbi:MULTISPECIES: Lrp/AsnC family transcriptional regulator [Cryobacterium]|uniref:Lrp/AsnC family transcriptional regulator n=1 Tax=Cryobacterium levicorallinum TaxID=995038 RepID=A0A1I2XS27_9MICO|nr:MULTISPECIES: Lrp/AsnC family transcriptional regulator [Cryobacterium]TFB84959.1 Lrp/AsnC family transcriptional regulator [Cryobacterium levicorallinum]TFD62330.1 Lrp/AsnC family transcriptional regulator [Cryobacterium sp. Hh38]GEP26158.1 AsnC family transcriptional regulator [Cryobacterium levicorallinum]SFH16273.1 Lrp/AsnC family transcriptional regulator, regulator for asnA, asnC and gidA [Cryobacterium levicorallinum]
MDVDSLDARLVTLFCERPKLSVLEASRRLKVARATVQARLDRLMSRGVIKSWAPTLNPSEFGYPVTAYCSLTVRQDSGHAVVVAALAKIPEILELHTVSGDSDMLARVVARSNADVQRVLDLIVATQTVVRSSSVIVLQTRIEAQALALLQATAAGTISTPGTPEPPVDRG